MPKAARRVGKDAVLVERILPFVRRVVNEDVPRPWPAAAQLAPDHSIVAESTGDKSRSGVFRMAYSLACLPPALGWWLR
jgi:hypothetical protein